MKDPPGRGHACGRDRAFSSAPSPFGYQTLHRRELSFHRKAQVRGLRYEGSGTRAQTCLRLLHNFRKGVGGAFSLSFLSRNSIDETHTAITAIPLPPLYPFYQQVTKERSLSTQGAYNHHKKEVKKIYIFFKFIQKEKGI